MNICAVGIYLLNPDKIIKTSNLCIN